jgi:hypothetical protein
MNRFVLTSAFLVVLCSSYAQLQPNYERMKYAIEHRNLGRVKQLLEQEPAGNKAVMTGWAFKVSANYNAQHIMQYLYTLDPPLDPEWMNTLVMGYWNEGRRVETEYWGVRALEVIEKQLGKEHEEYGIALQMLGILYFRDARYAQAEICLNQAYVIFKTKLGADDKRTIEMEKTILALKKEMGG